MSEAAALRLVFSLLAIVALILAAAWLIRRAGWLKTGADNPVRILGTRSLGGRSCITLVQVEDARLVLGVTSGQITLLHTLERDDRPPGAVPAAAPESGPFGASLRHAVARRG